MSRTRGVGQDLRHLSVCLGGAPAGRPSQRPKIVHRLVTLGWMAAPAAIRGCGRLRTAQADLYSAPGRPAVSNRERAVSERMIDPTATSGSPSQPIVRIAPTNPSPPRVPAVPDPRSGAPTEMPRPAFEIAVFDNGFPEPLDRSRRPQTSPATALIAMEPATGRCEVVVYSDRHDTTLRRWEWIAFGCWSTWSARYAVLGGEPQIRYVLAFENKGEIIGVTLPSPRADLRLQRRPTPSAPRAPGRHGYRAPGECVECAVVAGESPTAGASSRARRDGGFRAALGAISLEVHVAPVDHRSDLVELETPNATSGRPARDPAPGLRPALWFPAPVRHGHPSAPTCAAGAGRTAELRGLRGCPAGTP